MIRSRSVLPSSGGPFHLHSPPSAPAGCRVDAGGSFLLHVSVHHSRQDSGSAPLRPGRRTSPLRFRNTARLWKNRRTQLRRAGYLFRSQSEASEGSPSPPAPPAARTDALLLRGNQDFSHIFEPLKCVSCGTNASVNQTCSDSNFLPRLPGGGGGAATEAPDWLAGTPSHDTR